VKGKIVNLQGSGCKGSLILNVEEKKALPSGMRIHVNPTRTVRMKIH
jgi:hypothetical protein